MKKLMHFLARLFPYGKSGENVTAISAYHTLTSIKDKFTTVSANLIKRTSGSKGWSLVPGNYRLGNPGAPIAVCTLTSNQMIDRTSKLEGVAISGGVYTPNLGIEKIILNIINNPRIRYLVICGKDSSVFHPGQAIQSLFSFGINSENRINNAIGHFPVLRNTGRDQIERFCRQVKLIDLSGELDLETLHSTIKEIIDQDVEKSNKEGINIPEKAAALNITEEKFKELKPGGKRIPIDYDKNGFFVITVDKATKRINVKHYFKDNLPGYRISGHSAQSIILALLREDLVSQLSHAGYLGAELAKAETALRLNLHYQQDQPLRTFS